MPKCHIAVHWAGTVARCWLVTDCLSAWVAHTAMSLMVLHWICCSTITTRLRLANNSCDNGWSDRSPILVWLTWMGSGRRPYKVVTLLVNVLEKHTGSLIYRKYHHMFAEKCKLMDCIPTRCRCFGVTTHDWRGFRCGRLVSNSGVCSCSTVTHHCTCCWSITASWCPLNQQTTLLVSQ